MGVTDCCSFMKRGGGHITTATYMGIMLKDQRERERERERERAMSIEISVSH